MENTDFDWLDGNYALNYGTPEFSTSGSPRARHVYLHIDPDLVLALSDFWKVNFWARLKSLLKDEDKFLGDSYTCKETIIEISIKRSR
jgi:hypothetical protein